MTSKTDNPNTTLSLVSDRLREIYPDVAAPPASTPFEHVLWENVAYLATDDARAAAFERLRTDVGTTPESILNAPLEMLIEIAGAGMMPTSAVEKLRLSAHIAIENFDGDLWLGTGQPFTTAKKNLMRFPGIGEPGAEKILLLTLTHQCFPLDSNGLRVLERIGFGAQAKDYRKAYRSVQDAVRSQLIMSYDWLISCTLLLRRHGQEICKTSSPRCAECPLTEICRFYLST